MSAPDPPPCSLEYPRALAQDGRGRTEAATEALGPRPGAPRSGATRGWALAVIVFVVGASSLGAEIAAARLLGPYFGASTIVWANTIATVLLALSVGYALGGRLADRRPTIEALRWLVLAAALLLAAVPFAATPFLGYAVTAFDQLSIGTFIGSLLGVLALVAVPVLLLGAVAPFAVRLSVRAVEESGRVSGRLYAISTLGSLIGTFLAALLLIPLLGTRRTFLSFALALALVAAPGLRRWLLLVPAGVLVLIALPPGTVKATAGERVLYEAETPYQYVRVVQRPDGERRLELNEGQAVHSLLRSGSYLTGGYWDDPLVLPFTTLRHPPVRLAILGDAAGTTARAYGYFFPATRLDAVELDSQLTAIGRRYFDLRAPRLRTITADARPFLRRPGPSYDTIVIDAYRQPYIPFYLTTREFFGEVRRRLTAGGLALLNVGHPAGSTSLERVLSATMRSVFPYVMRDPVDDTNTWLVASYTPIDPNGLRAALEGIAPALRPLAAAVAGRLGLALSGGAVYTDDKAPVEWLIDGSLIRYAAGH